MRPARVLAPDRHEAPPRTYVGILGMIRRLQTLMKIWARELFAPAADPRQTFAYSYEKQRELLRSVQEALGHVQVAKARLEGKTAEVGKKLPALQDQARQALEKGDENAARAALERRTFAAAELDTLQAQLREVEGEEQRLSLVESRISSQIDAFFARQELIAARYSAAEAQVRIQEAMTGLSDELADLSIALSATEEKTEQMQARAFAIDRLVEGGSLGSTRAALLDVSHGDLGYGVSSADINEQLEALKRELDQGQAGPA